MRNWDDLSDRTLSISHFPSDLAEGRGKKLWNTGNRAKSKCSAPRSQSAIVASHRANSKRSTTHTNRQTLALRRSLPARPSTLRLRSGHRFAQDSRSRRVEVFGPMQLTDEPELAEVQGLGWRGGASKAVKNCWATVAIVPGWAIAKWTSPGSLAR